MPRIGASLAAYPAGSVTTLGLAHTVCWLTDSARSTPLRSKMAPRSAARLILRMRWPAPSFSYCEAETAWTWVRRRMTPDNPSERTISRAIARRPVSRLPVAASPASALARRAAMRRFGFGSPLAVAVLLPLAAPAAFVGGTPPTPRALGVRGLSLRPGPKMRLHLRPTAGQAGRGGIVGIGAVHRRRCHQIGDLRGDDHAQPLLGRRHDALRGRELGDVEAQLLVTHLLLGRFLVEVVEAELRLDQQHVEDGRAEDRADGEDGGGQQRQPQRTVGSRTPAGAAPHPVPLETALVQLADAGARRWRPALSRLLYEFLHHQTRSRTRKRALSARGLAAISS